MKGAKATDKGGKCTLIKKQARKNKMLVEQKLRTNEKALSRNTDVRP